MPLQSENRVTSPDLTFEDDDMQVVPIAGLRTTDKVSNSPGDEETPAGAQNAQNYQNN